jgi:radical SAM-linked protein
VSERPANTAEPRQRWRLVVARSAAAPDFAQREVAEGWVAAIEAAGLPVAWTEGARSRPRIAFGAPLPIGMAADAELIDVVLTERWPAWRLRETLTEHVPAGWRLVDVQDVWLAGPALAGRVAAADYRVVLAGDVPIDRLRAAAADLLAAPTLLRRRARGDESVEYDLRPLLIDVAIEDGPPVTVVTRTRFHPELGTGRPEEVVAALADCLGQNLDASMIVRDRLVLAEDLALD